MFNWAGLRLVLAIDAVTALTSFLMVNYMGSLGLASNDVEIFGQMLTTGLLVVGAIAYVQGVKGKFPLIPIILTALVGTLFAMLGGPNKTIISYHGLALLLHILTLRNYNRALLKAAHEAISQPTTTTTADETQASDDDNADDQHPNDEDAASNDADETKREAR